MIAREPGNEHSDRNTTKLEAGRVKDEGLHARFAHLVAEAGSIVLYVSSNMNEVKKDGEGSGDGEEGETAAAKEISRKDAEIRRLIEERKSTPKEEKRPLKELSKCIKKCIRDKKRVKRQQLIQIILEDFKVSATFQQSNLQRRKCSLRRLRIKEERSSHHEQGDRQCLW